MKKPFFSVVLPTRNRSKHLPLAIASVLNQTFGDFELIVSDNCSDDATPQVAQSFDDKRIKYFRSDKPLTIGDSYELGLSYASGEYITFIADDDAYVPCSLEHVKKVIDDLSAEIVSFGIAAYYRDRDFAFDREIGPGTLTFNSFTGRVTKFDSRQAIDLLFQSYGLNDLDRNDDFIIAYLCNAVYHHTVFSRIKAIRNEMFAATPADLYLAAAVMFATDEYYCLDEPLYVWHNWAENTTASPYKKGNEFREHYEKLLAGEPLRFTPLKFALHHNCCINAMLQAKDDFDKSDNVKVNWADYYVFSYNNLMVLKNTNVDVSKEIQEFIDILKQEPADIQKQVNERIHNFKFTVKQSFRKFPLAFRVAKSLLDRQRSQSRVFVNGRDHGFDNVLDATNFLETYRLGK